MAGTRNRKAGVLGEGNGREEQNGGEKERDVDSTRKEIILLGFSRRAKMLVDREIEGGREKAVVLLIARFFSLAMQNRIKYF